MRMAGWNLMGSAISSSILELK